MTERIEILDVLRGFALFVMLVAHANYLANNAQPLLATVTSFLLGGKGLSIFSMLFGMGFTIQMLRRHAAGRPFVRLYLRRMIVLFLIGVANWCLVSGAGDVLRVYAVYGCIMLLLSRLSPKSALACALLFMALNVWRPQIGTALRSALANHGADRVASQLAAGEEVAAARKNGSYADVVKAQSEHFLGRHMSVYAWLMLLFPTDFFPMFLAGFAAVKSGLLQTLREKRKLVLRILWGGLGVGLLSNLYWLEIIKLPYPMPLVNVWRLSFVISGSSLALFYASAIALAFQNPDWRRLLAPLAWPGRMALTNYIVHRAVVYAISDGYGLALGKRINTLQAWGIALIIFAVLWLFSVWWLRRFQYGPLEWIWRTLTYGRSATIRSRRPATAASAA